MDSANEQLQTDRRGDSVSGIDLQLKKEETEESDSQKLPDFFAHQEEQSELEPYQQMNLFPSVDEQIGNIVINHADDAFSLPTENLILDNMIDYALLTGGGKSNSRSRIFAKYQKGLEHEIMTEFLKQEYQMGGKGFTFEGEPLCIWYDEEGMRFSKGTVARHGSLRTLSWEEVEERTYKLIHNGNYMDEAEMWHVPMQEKKELASKIYFFFRDEYGTMPPEVTPKLYGYPEAEGDIIEKLSQPESLDEILKQMDKAIGAIKSGAVVPRFRLIYKPEDIREEIAELKREPLSFPAAQELEVSPETFITQDEIDYKLSRGSGFSEGLFRIYDFFLKEEDKKEQVKFLKQEYGTGGSSHALVGASNSYEDHDSKGIKLSKGSIFEPTAKILLTWPKVVERIRKLMETDRFLTPKAREQYNQWKLEREQRELERKQEALQEEKTDSRLVVAVESTEEDSELSVGFFTYHYQDGREGIRYRLVTRGEDGELEVYPEHNKFFINFEAINQYIDAHTEDIKVIPYDEMVNQGKEAMETQLESLHELEEVPEEEESADKSDSLEPHIEIQKPVIDREPEIDVTHAANYHITDETLGSGSTKEKFDRNIAAIMTLQLIESEKRLATPEEQELLAGYVGWGGLSEAFDERNSAWHDRYLTLKGLLSEEEYQSARESTLNAHYTSPTIIRSIYEALNHMGFEKGNMLEPSMGTGNFFGMLPENMKESRLYGVELDSLTGRIAKQLYPKAKIQVTGFEKTDYPNDFFDVVIGNVPFGQYKVSDKPYDKHNFLIHDYFLAKSLDKVRAGGVVAVVTSKGTMDKKSPAVRRYLAQRAELVGAIRLPNTAFKENAGTEVTSDILFFQKRDRVVDLEPDWIHLGENEEGIAINQYFTRHPEMVVGKMELVSGPYGIEPTCNPILDRPFAEQLSEAVERIHGTVESVGLDELEDDTEKTTIPADPTVKNYSYTIVEGEVYYRENSVMRPIEMQDSMLERIKGMVGIRDATNAVIKYQLEEYGESAIREKQEELSSLYDQFTKQYGLINSKTNKRAFSQDSSYCLLCSLEILSEDGTLDRKADMFTKRTIKKQEVITSVDTPMEALAVSMSEKACVDIGYMGSLLGGSENYDRIVTELSGIIFKNPMSDIEDPYDGWETGDEYLSGNVREKLEIAKLCAEKHMEYAANVVALEQIQPKLLDASEIEVRLGATWVDTPYINDFMRDVFETPEYKLNNNIIGTQYSNINGQWNIKGKSADFGNPLTDMTYGTGRDNAYKILEDSLNLRDSRIFDTIIEDGKEKRVLNKKETMLASQKQEAIREAFKDWIFRDVDRREVLCAKYNEIFNSNRPREYDGSHLTFPGMTPDIALRTHQKNAVAHQLYGNNTLLAHCVGAGKTYEMVAAAMENKRLGLAQKSLFVVPNHLTEQWSSDFLRLYPGANILAATKKDFEPANRKKFCSRIATGDYDAVIIGHSQFEKIPLSKERQMDMIDRQVEEITMEIESLKASQGERYTIKQMEKTKKSLLVRLERLSADSRKDDVVTFEQLGVDRLFVDESHNYKNLFLYTKMRNVAGIAQTEAQKSSDMFAKCRYMDELTGGKGITFATGTPISNSMTELYTNMRYLQYGTLQRLGLGHFDSWAASFGETITAIELAPEGTGYRAKTRFAKFFNLPELLSIFKESADIQTPDMLKLPVPEAIHENVVLKPSEHQQQMVSSLAERAEDVRNRVVDPSVDNMLKITSDGRKLALDQRLIDSMLPDEEQSKVGACVERAVKIWGETEDKKSAQLIFCDLSTPKNDGTFNVYHNIREKLIGKGVPPEEIAFIHNANTEIRKAELFAKVRSGQVRFLLGSTAKMGAGTNVQDKLIAEHHLDVPWRPSDIEQREGRIIRQGNQNEKVHIFRYVTEGTFDSYSWQLIENKQKFISQIMTSKSPVRSCEDIDEASLTYAEVKALATGNPYIKEKMDLDIQVAKLKLLKANHTSQVYRLEDNIAKHYPKKIGLLKERIEAYEIDVEHYKEVKPNKEVFAMKLGERLYTDKKEAGTALIAYCRQVKTPSVKVPIGEYLGYKMNVEFDTFYHKFTLHLKGALTHSLEVGGDVLGNLTRINNALDAMEGKMTEEQVTLRNTEKQLLNAKEEVTKPFPQESELEDKMERLVELNTLLNMDEKGSEECLDEAEEGLEVAERKVSDARPSIMEKLAMFKEQSSKTNIEPMKQKNKEEVL
ncbi:MAG: DEAD/DEAH box helicase family protein [Lachnospiraceae bacterium]